MGHALKTILTGLFFLLSAFSFAGEAIHPEARESTSKPFWTEKSSFTHKGFLYGVGIASEANSLDEGRGLAFEAGKRELQRALQITQIQNTGLTINTVETYEERNADGTYTVYRLVAIPLAELPPLISEQKRQPYKKETDIEYHERKAKEAWRSAFSEHQKHKRELYEGEAKGHERAIEIIHERAKRLKEAGEKEKAYRECLKEAGQSAWCPTMGTAEELKAVIASVKKAKAEERRIQVDLEKRNKALMSLPIHQRLKKEEECKEAYKTVQVEESPPIGWCTSWRLDSEDELREHEANLKVAMNVLLETAELCKPLFENYICGKLIRDGWQYLEEHGPLKFIEISHKLNKEMENERSSANRRRLAGAPQ